MRLLICGINYAPELVGVGKFTAEMATWMSGQGHEVRVVTAPPYYPTWQIGQGYRSWFYSREKINGVDVYRCPIWVRRQPSGIQRLLHLLSFSLSCLPIMLRQVYWRPDVVMSVEPPALCLPASLLVSRLSGARSWLHIQDFEIDSGFNLGIVPNVHWLRSVVLACERWLMRKCHLVSTISEAMLDRLCLKGVSPERIILFPNWVDTSQIYPLPETVNPLRNQLGFEAADSIALYAGTMGNKQGLDLLIEAARYLQDEVPKLKIVLAGDGPSREPLAGMVRTLGLNNVRFLPFVPAEQFNQMLNMADINVLIQKSAATDLVMPSKLTGMMASGRPVVATAHHDSAVGRVIVEADCGYLVPPENLKALVKALRQASTNPQERQVLGRNGRKFAERELDKEQILASVEAQVKKLVKRPASKWAATVTSSGQIDLPKTGNAQNLK
jgi:colanic acid biosynthesis glycosyl transferase WcaI